MKPNINFLPATAADIEQAIPLIYSSGPDAFEYGFSLAGKKAQDFIRFAYEDGAGFFGWRNHQVALINDQVVGIGAFYSGHDYQRLSNETGKQLLHFYPLTALPKLIRRALQLKGLMPPPAQSMQYVANLGVAADMRSQGIGAALLNQQLAVAKQLGRKTYALDVATKNSRGQALYERFGFKQTTEQFFAGPANAVSDTRRMEIDLVAYN